MFYGTAAAVLFAIFSLPAFSQKSQECDPQQFSQDREFQVEAWLQFWQTRLSLDDWTVSVRLVCLSDLHPDTLGHLVWHPDTRIAQISVLDPSGYDVTRGEEYIAHSEEETVLHELLHLSLGVLPRVPDRNVEEALVNKLMGALMNDPVHEPARQKTKPVLPAQRPTAVQASRARTK